MLFHQLKRAIIRHLLLRKRRHLKRALVNPEKNEIVPRRRFTALPPEQVFEALFAAPRRGEKRDLSKKVTGNNRRRPKRADHGEDQAPVSRQPIHSRIVRNCLPTANAKLVICPRRSILHARFAVEPDLHT